MDPDQGDGFLSANAGLACQSKRGPPISLVGQSVRSDRSCGLIFFAITDLVGYSPSASTRCAALRFGLVLYHLGAVNTGAAERSG